MELKFQQKKSCNCNHSGEEATSSAGNDKTLLALLPCGLRNPFLQELQLKFPEVIDNEKYVIDGNLNYEKSFYQQLNTEEGYNAIPDIFISSDINDIYHQSFIKNFLNDNYFERIQPPVNELFKNNDFVHSTGHICWLTANLLVIVADTEKVHEDLFPVSWKDLLNEYFQKELTLRGDDDFFCNAILFPFLKDYGQEAVTQLGKNTAKGLHPSQMVKNLNAGNTGGTAIYVMPYSFAMKVRDTKRFRIVIPEEGAIVSPVQLMVKKSAYNKNKRLIDFLLGSEMGSALVRNGFPALTQKSTDFSQITKYNWVGWDFILKNDISACKIELQHLFYKGFNL